jgi:hypothetical protein
VITHTSTAYPGFEYLLMVRIYLRKVRVTGVVNSVVHRMRSKTMTFHKASSSIAKTVMTHKVVCSSTTPSCSPIRPVRIFKGDPEGIQQEVLGRSGFAIESRYNKV